MTNKERMKRDVDMMYERLNKFYAYNFCRCESNVRKLNKNLKCLTCNKRFRVGK